MHRGRTHCAPIASVRGEFLVVRMMRMLLLSCMVFRTIVSVQDVGLVREREGDAVWVLLAEFTGEVTFHHVTHERLRCRMREGTQWTSPNLWSPSPNPHVRCDNVVSYKYLILRQPTSPLCSSIQSS
jgi:hypothetical protein